MSIAYPLRIYYDQSCPLCAREMHALKRHDRHARIELVDCSVAGFCDSAAEQAGYSATDFMTLIHARDAQGRWLKGVAVFEAAYAAAGIDAMARAWAHPLLRPLWDRLYPQVAKHRMGLSKLGVTGLFGWLVERAAKNAAENSRACAEGRCELTEESRKP